MKGTPTFELRPGPNLHIVRVGVEYPPDATPDAPMPGEGAPAFLELTRNAATFCTASTHRGFELPWPEDGAGAMVWLFYRDGAGRTQRCQVHRDHLGRSEVVDPDFVNWGVVALETGDVHEWPAQVGGR